MFCDFVNNYFRGLASCQAEISIEKLNTILNVLLSAQREGRTIFILGNGGSATTASHMACDLGKGAAVPGSPRLRAISLTDNIALLTAWANDVNYESVFKEQLANLLEPGDIVVGISASGNSPNVLRAIEFANQHGAVTIGFIGFGGGKLRDLVQIDVTISSRNYGVVEDFHSILNHVLAQYLTQLNHVTASAGAFSALTPSRQTLIGSTPAS